MEPRTNPLRQFFRQPAIYIRLPSQGRFWPPESLEMPDNKELPVLPMTAIDEITYRTPDALYNGEAVVKVIQSCMPNIKNAWDIPTMDFDTILVAIRIASYGHAMPVETTCPQCQTEASYEVDLRNLLDGLQAADYGVTVRQSDVEIFFKPLTYRQITDNSLRQFEEQKIINILPQTDMPEKEKLERLNAAVTKLTEMTIETLAYTISLIKTPQAQVTEFEFIREYLENLDSRHFNEIRDHVVSLRESNELRPLKIQCQSCSNEYEQPLTLDQATFFEAAS